MLFSSDLAVSSSIFVGAEREENLNLGLLFDLARSERAGRSGAGLASDLARLGQTRQSFLGVSAVGSVVLDRQVVGEDVLLDHLTRGLLTTAAEGDDSVEDHLLEAGVAGLGHGRGLLHRWSRHDESQK